MINSEKNKNKIKIAYVLTPIEFGGSEKVNLNFLNNFNEGKFEIIPILLVRPWEDKNYFIQEVEKNKIHYLTIPVAIKPLERGKDYLRIIRCFHRLFSILRRDNFDIIHTHGYFADIIGLLSAKIFRIPHVSTCHGFIKNDNRLRLYNSLDVFFLRFVDKIISVADEIKDVLIGKGVSGNKIQIIQNAVMLPALTNGELREKRLFTRKKYKIAHNEVVVGYIGRLSKEKGLKYLFESGILLNRMGLAIKIMLIGDGPERKILEIFAKKNGIERQVIFTGFQKDALELLPALDMFVLPSLSEGTPMALLEAMSYGIPAIASEVGGIPKVIISGENGVLVTPKKPIELADAIFQLSKTEEYRVRLSNKGKDCIKEKYDLMAWVYKIESIYLNLKR